MTEKTRETKYAEWVELDSDPAPAPARQQPPLRPVIAGQGKQALQTAGAVAAKVGAGIGAVVVGGLTVGAVIVGGIVVGAGSILLSLVGEAAHAVKSLSAPSGPGPQDRELPGGWSNKKNQITIINNVHINEHSK